MKYPFSVNDKTIFPIQLPWWTWILPGLLCHLGTQISVLSQISPAISLGYLPVPIGIVLIHWWGPRILLGLFVNASLSAGLWGFTSWPLYPIYALPETIGVFLSWFFFKVTAKGKCWFPDTKEMWQFILWGVGIPVIISFVLKQILINRTAVRSHDLLQWTILTIWIAEILIAIVLSIAFLFFLTRWMEKRGMALTQDATHPSLFGGETLSFRKSAEISALFSALLFSTVTIPMASGWYINGILVQWIAIRFGLGLTILANLWIILSVFSFPSVFSESFASIWTTSSSMQNELIGLVILCITALLLGRIIDDLQKEIARQKYAEWHSQRNRFTLDQIVNSLPQSIFWKDNNSVYMGCNQAFANACGLSSQKEIIGKTDFDLPWPRQEAEAYRADDREVIQLQTSKNHIIEPLQQANGKRLWIDTTKVPLVDSEGQVFGVLGIYEDISDRKETETHLEYIRLLLEAVLEQSPVPIVVASSPDLIIRYANQAASELLGVQDEPSYIGCSFEDIKQRKSWKDFRKDGTLFPVEELPLAKALLGEPTQAEEYYLIRKDGEKRWIFVNGSPIYNRNGEIIGGLIVFPDITERHQAEETLRESENRLRTIISSMPVLLDAFDEKGRVVFWNIECERVTGYSAAEVIGNPHIFKQFYPNDSYRQWVYDSIGKKWGNFRNLEFEITCKDGSIRIISWTNISESVSIPGWYTWAVGIDITDQKTAEAALRISEARFRNIIEASPMGVHLYELDSNDNLIFTGYNQAANTILAIDCSQFVGRTIDEAFPPLIHTEIPEKYLLAARDGIPSHLERIEYDDEKIKGAYEIYAFETSPRCMAAFFLDISERKQHEIIQKQNLEEIERFNRLFVGREQKIIELKSIVNNLSNKLGIEIPFHPITNDYNPGENFIPFPESDRNPSEECLPEDYNLAEIVNITQLHNLLDSFCNAVGIASAIIDLHGNILIRARWQPICTDFHRIHPQSCARCQESDSYMGGALMEGKRFAIYRCRNGLMDAASPILINGQHVANAFVGQFLSAPPDEAFFSRQAIEYGYDQDAYLEALRKVPIVPQEKLPAILGFVNMVAEIVTQMSWEKIQQQKIETIIARRAEELNDKNRELHHQRLAAISLAEDAEIARLHLEHSQAALQESMRRFDELVTRIPVGAYRFRVSSGVHSFDYVSPRFCSILGLNQDDILKNPQLPFDPAHPDDHDDLILSNQIAIEKKGHFAWEGRFIVHQQIRWIRIESFPAQLDNGDWIWDGILQDITASRIAEEEKAKLESQLIQAQKMEAIGQLAGGVAHDFNNLLQVINGYTEMALHSMDRTSSAGKYLSEVSKAGERAARLVAQLLAFSRRQLMKPETLDVNEVIAHLLNMLSRLIGEHIRLDFIPGHQLGTINADRGMIEQIIMNLCVNARDAMPTGGTLTIESENIFIDRDYCDTHSDTKPGHYVRIAITDNGIGMDEETRSHVFEPFFTTKGPGQGTGLGLATVYGIVKQHDGMIQVYSEMEKGTIFKIYLPISKNKNIPSEIKAEGSAIGGNETILLAEDDEMVRTLVQRFLEDAGYTVLVAKDGEDAIGLYRQYAQEIDLLLLDVVMPNKGGREVYDMVRKENPSIRVLFASGYSENAVHTNFVLDEGLELIQKPYNRNNLLRTIRRLLDTPLPRT